MSLAAETREAVRDRPFLLAALRAGIVNYSAAAAWVTDDAGLDGDTDAIATALRRFREELPPYETSDRTATVTMQSGVGIESASDVDPEDADGPAFRVGDAAIVPTGNATAIVATGDVDVPALAAILDRLATAGIDADAAGVADGSLVIVVDRRDGPQAVRAVEGALESVPDSEC